MKGIGKLTRILPALLMFGAGLVLTSCFDDEKTPEQTYAEWKSRNEQYLADAAALKGEDGSLYYSRITPSWAPNTYILIHWHNDTTLTASNLVPIDNSVTSITYQLFDIDGKEISNSFSNSDSTYTSRPSQNIIGMWAALTNMHVGDSVTMVLPSTAGYGSVGRTSIPPYSTLVYGVKLKAIPAYEIP